MKKLFTVTFTEQDNWHEPTIIVVNTSTKEKAYEIGLEQIGRTKEEMEKLYNQEPSDSESEYSHIEQEVEVIEEEYSGDKDLNNLFIISIKHSITKYFDVCLNEPINLISHYIRNIFDNNEILLSDIKNNELGSYDKYYSDDRLKDEFNKFKNAFEYSYYFENDDTEEIKTIYPDEDEDFFEVENTENYYFKVFNKKTNTYLADSYDTESYKNLIFSILSDFIYINYFGIFRINISRFSGISLQFIEDCENIYFENYNNEYDYVPEDKLIEEILESNFSKYPEISRCKNELTDIYSFYKSLLCDIKYENIKDCFNSNVILSFKNYDIYISKSEFNNIRKDFEGNENSIKFIGKNIWTLF